MLLHKTRNHAKFCGDRSKNFGDIHDRKFVLRKSGPKFTKIIYGMLLHKTPNRAKFYGDRLKNAGDIRNRKFLLPEKVESGSKFTYFLGDATP